MCCPYFAPTCDSGKIWMCRFLGACLSFCLAACQASLSVVPFWPDCHPAGARGMLAGAEALGGSGSRLLVVAPCIRRYDASADPRGRARGGGQCCPLRLAASPASSAPASPFCVLFSGRQEPIIALAHPQQHHACASRSWADKHGAHARREQGV